MEIALCYASAGEHGRWQMADSRVFSKVSVLLHRQLSTSSGELSGASHTILPPVDSCLVRVITRQILLYLRAIFQFHLDQCKTYLWLHSG